MKISTFNKSTQTSLVDLVPTLVQHIEEREEAIEINQELFQIYNGDILTSLKQKIKANTQSPQTLQQLLGRISSVNILTQTINKTSRIYDTSPVREALEDSDVELLTGLAKSMDASQAFDSTCTQLSLTKHTALEIYTDENQPALRNLPSHTFTVWSDDPVAPNNPTVFIKFGPSESVASNKQFNRDGSKVSKSDQYVDRVQLYFAYSKDEIVVFDSSGSIREDKMEELGLEGSENPLGFCPFVYLNEDEYNLLPVPARDDIEITTLVPMLMTELNLAIKYQAYSIIAVTGAKAEGLSLGKAPDSVWFFEGEAEGIVPNVEAITPNVDVDKMIMNIKENIGLWLSSKGLSGAKVGDMGPGNSMSGLSKIIDEADVSKVLNRKKNDFQAVENAIWEKVSVFQNDFWNNLTEVKVKGKFTDGFMPSVIFKAVEVMKTLKDAVEEQKLLLDNRLTTQRRALKAIYPDMKEEEILALIQEIAEESSFQLPQLEGEDDVEG